MTKHNPGNWDYGNLYENPPRLHLCLRCGERRPNIELHDDLHAEIDGSA